MASQPGNVPPPPANRRRLLRLQSVAYHTLSLVRAAPPMPESVTVDDGAEVRLTLIVSHIDDASELARQDPARDPQLQMMFGSLERQILAFIVSRGEAKGTAIGRAVGELDSRGEGTSRLRIILRGLIDRHVLDNDDRGYFITDAFRPYVAQHIPAVEPPASAEEDVEDPDQADEEPPPDAR